MRPRWKPSVLTFTTEPFPPPKQQPSPPPTDSMKLSDLKSSGHWPTLLTAFLYFDFSFMAWTVLGALGAQIGETLHLDAGQKGLMVAMPILGGAILRLVLGLLVDRIGAKTTGIMAQIIVMLGLAAAWLLGVPSLTT